MRLSGTKLQRLFETEQPSLAVITGITLGCDRSVISRNPDIIATFADEVIDISVSFQIPPDEYESDWTIRVNRIRNTICENFKDNLKKNFTNKKRDSSESL